MEGPPLGPGGEDITWPDKVAPRGRKASSTRKIKPQTSNLTKQGYPVASPLILCIMRNGRDSRDKAIYYYLPKRSFQMEFVSVLRLQGRAEEVCGSLWTSRRKWDNNSTPAWRIQCGRPHQS